MPDRSTLMLDNTIAAVNDGFSYDKIVSVPELGLEDAWQRPGLVGWIDTIKDVVQKPFRSLQAVAHRVFGKESSDTQGTPNDVVVDIDPPVNRQDSQDSLALQGPNPRQPRKRNPLKGEPLGKGKDKDEGAYIREEYRSEPGSDIRGGSEEIGEREVSSSQELSSRQPRKRNSVRGESAGKGKDRDDDVCIYEEHLPQPGSSIQGGSEERASPPADNGKTARKRNVQHHEEIKDQSSSGGSGQEVDADHERQPRKLK